MKKGDTGAAVATLQRQLVNAGLKVTVDGWFDVATETAVVAFQRRIGLVADGIAGPRTQAALLTRNRNRQHLAERDLEAAAERLGVELAAIKAVSEVESGSAGFLDDGRPVILYERHVAYRQLGEAGVDIDEADHLAERYPNVVNLKRGGYAGGAAEWARLAHARQVLPDGIPEAACSWGRYQLMGYHWQVLGYPLIETFVSAMASSESAQLAAFLTFIEANPALHKALKAKKWAEFAKIYNGPAYRDNAYDGKLASAYARHVRLLEPRAEREAA